jgi:hypothetical protein
MMAKAPKPLADSVAETLLKKKTPCWWTDIPESVYRDVEAIKAKWVAGEWRDGDGRPVTAHALSQAIAKSLNERKISTVGRQGVLAWLKRTNP